MGELRKPFLVAAVALILVVVAIEMEATWFLGSITAKADDLAADGLPRAINHRAQRAIEEAACAANAYVSTCAYASNDSLTMLKSRRTFR